MSTTRIDTLLRYMHEHGGSDLHLAAGLEPRVRIGGALLPVADHGPLTEHELSQMMEGLASPNHWRDFERTLDVDFAYGLPGVARFRVNYFCQERGVAAVLRIIPEKIRSFEELGVPPAVTKFVHLRGGLVLVTGPTGSGKSTTLAAIIDAINTTYEKHIVTIEDPIEFVHPTKKALFSQREVGAHTVSFAAALRAAIRQNPDVILVGEMRDHETIALALTAAEMGMLVFGTLHTNSAVKTINRLIDAFPAEEQTQARVSLSSALAGVVAQLLLPTADGGGRVAAHEILLRTSGLPNLIREDKTGLLRSLIQNNRELGMQMMDDALMTLVESQRILPRDAFQKAQDKGRFEPLLPRE
ncbi:MAG: type IV pilus twitching motility protein PilT [Myxococcota bacterium]